MITKSPAAVYPVLGKPIKTNVTCVSQGAGLSINSLVTMIFCAMELWGHAEQKIQIVVTHIYIKNRRSYQR